jgi:hypothetical protein
LLELAEWCRQRLEGSYGGDPWLTTTDGLQTKRGRVSGPADRTLEAAAGGGSAGDRADRGGDDRPSDPSSEARGGIE